MSVDVWSEPLLYSTIDEPEKQPSKRGSLFLSDSGDEDGQHASAPATSSPKDNGVFAAPEASKLDAMFADLNDDDDDVFRVEPALDIEKMKRQANAHVAANTVAARSLAPSLTPGDVADKKGPGDKGRDTKQTKRVVAKLDEERLLSTEGFPRLIKDSKRFRINGKGHEVADLERLFHLYHGWTHKMFPKFQFRDTVDRVEKLCRSRRMAVNLRAWRDAANGVVPGVRHDVTQDGEEQNDQREDQRDEDDVSSENQTADMKLPSTAPSSRPSTPVTLLGSAASSTPSVPSSATDKDSMDIDIDILLREEEEMMREIQGTDKGSTSYKVSRPDDDEEALWAATGGISKDSPAAVRGSSAGAAPEEGDDEELWNIAAEMEAQLPARPHSQNLPTTSAEQPSIGGDWDDMYA